MSQRSGTIRVLHVDDDVGFAASTGELLERVDDRLSVQTATSGTDAVEMLAESDVDCVVSDYDMPGMDGLDLLDAVREDWPDLPFILYTGAGSEEIASDALTLGATDYLQKRPGIEQYELLANRISNVVEQHRAEQAAETATRRFRALIEEATELIAVLDDDGRFGYLSPGTERLLGYPPERLLGKCAFDYVHPDDVGDATEQFAGLLADPGRRPTGEYRFARADGGWQWLEIRTRNMLEDPVIDGVVAYANDVSERKEREQRLDALHGATRQLLQADTMEDILSAGSEAMSNVVGFETNSIRLYDPESEALTIALRSERSTTLIGSSLMPYEVDTTPAGEAYTSGEVVVDPVQPDDPYGREPLTECVYVPLGDHGVFNLGTTAPDGVDHDALAHAEILATNLTVALDLHVRKEQFQEREDQLAALLAATRELVLAPTVEEIAETAIDAVEEIFGLSVNSIRFYDAETDTLVPRIITPAAERDVGSRPPYDVEGTPAGRAYRTGQTVRSAVEPDDPYDRNPLAASLYIPLGEYGILSIGAFTGDAFDEPTVRIAEVFAANVEATLDRADQENRLETLHEAARALVLATSPEEVAQRTAEAAKEILEYSNNVVRLVDGGGTRLHPVAVTSAARREMGERPVYTVGEGPVGEVYESGEPRIYGDVRTVDDGHDRGDARAVMYVPIGAHGILCIGETSVDAFGRSDVQLASILAATTETVLDRIERERELERQNERLEQFTSLVSHDLRNPLNVAQGRLEMLAEDHDSEHLAPITDAHERMGALIEDLLALARTGQPIEEPEPVALAALAQDAWRLVETGDAELVVDGDLDLEADPDRLQQLLENLVRNAVEHGGDDVTVTVGPLEGERGFFVEDDGPGIDPDDRERVFETGFTTAADGTGFGLAIVSEVAEAHGWRVRAVEGERGGARFEFAGTTSPA